jgi:hypothetical protein
MLNKEVLNSFLKENMDKEVTVCMNDKMYFTGTVKKIGSNHFVLSNYASNKQIVSSNDVIACHAAHDKPEVKYMPAMAEK